MVFLEPKRLYRSVSESVTDDGASLPLDHAFLLREGTDVTLVGWGAALSEILDVADTLSDNGIDAEVIDVATLRLLDVATVLTSIEKTGRCVIVHEAPLSSGFGAEVAARIADEGLMNLLAPVERVTGWDTIMPLSRLEAHYMPSTARILASVRRVMEYT